MVASAALLWWSSAMVVVVHAMGAGASSIHGFHSGGISGGAEGALMRTRALVEAVEAADDGHVHGGGRADGLRPSSCFVRVYREFREPCASILEDGGCKFALAILNCDLRAAGLKAMSCDGGCERCLRSSRMRVPGAGAGGGGPGHAPAGWLLGMYRLLFSPRDGGVSDGDGDGDGDPSLLFSIFEGWKSSIFSVCSFIEEKNRAAVQQEQQEDARMFANEMAASLAADRAALGLHIEHARAGLASLMELTREHLNEMVGSFAAQVASQREAAEEGSAEIREWHAAIRREASSLHQAVRAEAASAAAAVRAVHGDVEAAAAGMADQLERLAPLASLVERALGDDLAHDAALFERLEGMHATATAVLAESRRVLGLVRAGGGADGRSFAFLPVVCYYVSLFTLSSILVRALQKAQSAVCGSRQSLVFTRASILAVACFFGLELLVCAFRLAELAPSMERSPWWVVPPSDVDSWVVPGRRLFLLTLFAAFVASVLDLMVRAVYDALAWACRCVASAVGSCRALVLRWRLARMRARDGLSEHVITSGDGELATLLRRQLDHELDEMFVLRQRLLGR